MKRWQDLFTSMPGRTYVGHGYSLRVIQQGTVLRYEDGGQVLTLLGQMTDKTEEVGRTWLFFRTMAQVVYLPLRPQWDSGDGIKPDRLALIQGNIKSALSKLGEKCLFETSDAVYSRAAEDFDSLGRGPKDIDD